MPFVLFTSTHPEKVVFFSCSYWSVCGNMLIVACMIIITLMLQFPNTLTLANLVVSGWKKTRTVKKDEEESFTKFITSTLISITSLTNVSHALMIFNQMKLFGKITFIARKYNELFASTFFVGAEHIEVLTFWISNHLTAHFN